MITSNTARLFAKKFDARFAGMVILPDCQFKKRGGGGKSMKIDKIHNIRVQKIQGVIFQKTPKRRRQLRHSREGLVCVHACMYVYIYIYTQISKYPSIHI